MKKFALLCFFISGFFSAHAQLEWAPIGAKYHYSFSDEDGDLSVVTSEVMDEILIAGKACRRFSNAWALGGFCDGMGVTYEEDGRVYYYNSEIQDFSLLYDFNKGPGESWVMPICAALCGEPDSILIHVDSVSMTEINGMPIRTQHVSWDYPRDWGTPIPAGSIIYEGIGNKEIMYFAFRHPCGALTHSLITSLNCYESPVHGVFNFRGEVPCDQFWPTSAEEAPTAAPQLWLFPNPVSDELEIRFTSIPLSTIQLRIFDLHGKLMRQLEQGVINNLLVLPVAEWPTGMYVLEWSTDGVLWDTRRFVRQ